ncbi:hypothetical protein [Bacillus phage BM-P1]|nr:hypothetical protein [Bacillus phage BM-P1]
MNRVEVKFALEYTRYLENPTEEDIVKEITGEEIEGWE